jgi:transcriptional regulator with XRE-family HTH domain
MSTTHDDAQPSLRGLAGRLRALREATHPRISQTAAARAIGASQNKISRAESGQWLLEPAQVRTLARLYGATRAEQRQLEEWAEALAPAQVDSRLMLRRAGGTAAFQARLHRIQQAASLVRAYQPALVIGVLQTEAYARQLFGPSDPSGLSERMRQSDQMLRDERRRWVLVQTEGALLWNLGGAQVMAEQIDTIIERSQLPHVDLRLITHHQAVDFVAAHGFSLYDQQTAIVGILSGTTISNDPRDVEQYGSKFEQLLRASIGGDEARAALTRIADRYRTGG